MTVFLAALLAAVALAAAPRLPAAASAPKSSAVITVTNTNDDGPGSLRQAIRDALPGDTINFAPALNGGTITLLRANSQRPASGELKIDKELTISGPGKDKLTVSGGGNVRVFNVGSSTPGVFVLISGLKITRGDADTIDPNGSAIRNAGALVVENCHVTENRDFSEGTDFRGGGIFNAGSLTLSNSVVNKNQFRAGAGIANASTGALTIRDSEISDNLSEPGEGGGLFNDGGVVLITRSRFLFNQAQREGGGIYNRRGTLTVEDSDILSNASGSGGGGGLFTTLANAAVNGPSVFVNNSRVRNNVSFAAPGGGIHSLDSKLGISRSDISANVNVAGTGGGVFVSRGTLDIADSNVSDNLADFAGGGISVNSGTVSVTRSTVSHNATSGNPGRGGGITNASGVLTITACTISDNRSKDQGGGISNSSAGKVSIFASTISGNTLGRFGGGLFNAGTMTLDSCAVVNNSATLFNEGRGGGILGPVTLRNSVVALNKAAGTDSGTPQPPDIVGAVTSQGFNLIGDTRGATVNGDTTGNVLNADPLLGPLQDNGGRTPTHAPLPGSPLIDAGSGGANPDQRGLGRTVDFPSIPNAAGGDGTDIGALELQPFKISGRVNDAGGGVLMTLSGKQTVVTRAQDDGTYSFDVPPGGSFTLTPAKPGFTFSPPSASFVNLQQSAQADFNADELSDLPPPSEVLEGFDGAASPLFRLGLLSSDPAAFNPETAVRQEEGQLKITPPTLADEVIEVVTPCGVPNPPNCTQTQGGSFLKDGSFDGDSFNGYVTKNSLDLNVTTAVSVEVEKTVKGDGAETNFAVGKDKENFYGIRVAETAPSQAGGANPRHLIFDIVLGGAKSATPSVTYDPDKHRHWRIRFDAPASQIVFETSRDGAAWENPCPPPQTCRFPVGAGPTVVAAQLMAGTTRRIDDAGTAAFDDFRVAHPTGIGFSTTNFAASEKDRHITLTLTRTGDVAGRAEVGFTVRQGATPFPGGTFVFAEGQRDAAFTILNPLPDDTVRQGDRTLSLALLPDAKGGALIPGFSAAALTIADDEPPPSGNKIDDDSIFFTSQHYCDFLNRPPDDEGLNHWRNVLDSCGSDAQCREVRRINVSAAFFLSIELQETGYLVYRAYQATLGRMPTREQEFLPDTRKVRGGVIVNKGKWREELDANKLAFINEWVQRPAFKERFDALNSADFVKTLYENAGVPLTNERKTELSLALLTGRTTRRHVFAGLLDSKAAPGSPEASESELFRSRHTNRAFVLMQYFGYLQRDPDAGGFQHWLEKLDRFDGNFVAAEMVKAFLDSDEYRRRFEGKQFASCVGP